MKILITGGCGFIGSNFIRYIIREHPDWKIVNLDKLTYAGNLKNLEDIKDNINYKFVKGDIADRILIDELFSKEKFDAVVNFAAESHVDRSILDASPFIETNIKGVQVLLEAARKYPVWRFIQISTDEVYGSLGEKGKFTEESPLQPNSPYAASKAAADLICRSYYKAYGIPIIITRSSNNYGPYQYIEKFVPLMIINSIKGYPLPVYGKGGNIREWLYVGDNCRAIDLILNKGKTGECYNISSGKEMRNIDLIYLIFDLLSGKINKSIEELERLITFIDDPRGNAHDYRYSLDCTKINKELMWEPKNSLEEGINKTIDWYLENGSWVESVLSGEYKNYFEIHYKNLGKKEYSQMNS